MGSAMSAKRSVKSLLKSRWTVILSVAVLIVSLVVGSYLRLYPVFIAERWGYGPTLQELDPYSEYWIAKQLLDHGLDYFGKLTKENPVTHIFWYPWGRDFTRTSPPMLSIFSVVTYYVAHLFNPGLTLYEWMVYLPVLFFIMTALGIYFAARELWGDIPAAMAVLTASLMFISRHLAGFTVKYAIGLAFLFPAIYFHIRAWKRREYVTAALAGIFIAFTAMSWAGFNVLLGIIALQVAILPLMKRIDKTDVLLWTFETLPVAAAIISTPFYGWHYLIKSVGVVIPGGFIALGIALGLQKLASKREIVVSMPLFRRVKLLYTLILVLAGVGGFVAIISGFITVKGKALAALGLTGIVHVLVTTVQEYAPGRPEVFINSEGAALIVSILMVVYFAYRAVMKKDILHFFVGALFVTSLYATINLSYFFPYMNYLVAFVSAGFVYVLTRKVLQEGFRRDWFMNAVATVIVVLYVVSVLFQGTTVWARTYQYQVPMILDSGTQLGIEAPAWLDTLSWLNESTAKDAVAVSWWDYGYWLSVLGGKITVADGSTLNSTQITYLAKALTGTEEEAYEIFTKKFQIPPDKLYFVTYEIYWVDETKGLVYIGPHVLGSYYVGADAAKGVAAIYRIAGRTPPIYTYRPSMYATYGYNLPDWTNETLQNAFLFKVLLNTAYEVWGEAGFRVGFIYANPSNPPIIPRPNMTVFEPAQISISRLMSNPDLYVVVSVYKVKGLAQG